MREHPTAPAPKGGKEEMEARSRSCALEFTVAATQLVTLLCLLKGNPAWRGSLSLLFFGAAAQLLYKYQSRGQRPYLAVGVGLGLVGLCLILWFLLTG